MLALRSPSLRSGRFQWRMLAVLCDCSEAWSGILIERVLWKRGVWFTVSSTACQAAAADSTNTLNEIEAYDRGSFVLPVPHLHRHAVGASYCYGRSYSFRNCTILDLQLLTASISMQWCHLGLSLHQPFVFLEQEHFPGETSNAQIFNMWDNGGLLLRRNVWTAGDFHLILLFPRRNQFIFQMQVVWFSSGAQCHTSEMTKISLSDQKHLCFFILILCGQSAALYSVSKFHGPMNGPVGMNWNKMLLTC